MIAQRMPQRYIFVVDFRNIKPVIPKTKYETPNPARRE
jgi:hypothetical protein